MDFVKSWKSEYCSIEFKAKVGGRRVVKGLRASAFRALVSNMTAAVLGSPMTAKVQTKTTYTDTVNASQRLFCRTVEAAKTLTQGLPVMQYNPWKGNPL